MKYARALGFWLLLSTLLLSYSLANTSQFGDVNLYELVKRFTLPAPRAVNPVTELMAQNA